MNLFSLSNILTATGFRKDMLDSIYDFDLKAFVGFIRGLDKDNCTALQSMLLAYYHSCSSRVRHEEIHDFSYKQVSYSFNFTAIATTTKFYVVVQVVDLQRLLEEI